MGRGFARKPVGGFIDPPAHQLHAQKQKVGLHHVVAAVAMDLLQPALLVQFLDLRAVDFHLARQTDHLEQQVHPAAQSAAGAEVGQVVEEIEMALAGVARARRPGTFGEVRGRGDSVAQRREFEHRKIEAPPVERDQASGETLGARPELARQRFLGVAVEREAFDRAQYVIGADIANRDRNRYVQAERKKIAAAPRAQLLAETLERILVAQTLAGAERLVEQALVDARLDVEYCEHRCCRRAVRCRRPAVQASVRSSPSMTRSAIERNSAATGWSGRTATSGRA